MTQNKSHLLLAHYLKQLKLPTILREYAAVVTACTQDRCDYVSRVLGSIRESFLAGANVSNALKMALDRLDNTCSKQGYKKAMVVVLTDGHLEDSDVARILKLAQEFRKRNWPLYITGDSNTNKNLLIAANKDLINWGSIADLNPALWLQQARASLSNPEAGPAKQTEERRTLPSSTTTLPTVGQSRLRPLPRPPFPAPEQDMQLHIQGTPKPSQDSITAVSRAEVEVRFPGGRPTATEPAKGPSEKAKPPASSAPVEPSQKSTPVKSTKDGKEQASSQARPPLWTRAKHLISHFWPWLALGAFTILSVAIGLLLIRGSRRARQVREKLRGLLKNRRPINGGMLIATINGLTRQLGRLSRLRSVYVGSGARNTLRITEKGVSDRHLCLYQKAGKLMLQNLSSKPITISGSAVQSKAKRPLALPAVIELTENVRLRLTMARPSENTVGEKEQRL
jgi:hypothetical protein